MTGADWLLVASLASVVLMLGGLIGSMQLARARMVRLVDASRERDHWRRIAAERGAEAERLARESAKLIEERTELLSRVREETEEGPAPSSDTRDLLDALRRISPEASLASAPGPRGPVTSVSLAAIAGLGTVRPLHALPEAVRRARENGLKVQPADLGRRFATSHEADGLIGRLADTLLADARERLGGGATVQLSLQWDAPSVVIRLTPR